MGSCILGLRRFDLGTFCEKLAYANVVLRGHYISRKRFENWSLIIGREKRKLGRIFGRLCRSTRLLISCRRKLSSVSG